MPELLDCGCSFSFIEPSSIARQSSSTLSPPCILRRIVEFQRFLMALSVRPWSSLEISTHLFPIVRWACPARAHVLVEVVLMEIGDGGDGVHTGVRGGGGGRTAAGDGHKTLYLEKNPILLLCPLLLLDAWVQLIVPPLPALLSATTLQTTRHECARRALQTCVCRHVCRQPGRRMRQNHVGTVQLNALYYLEPDRSRRTARTGMWDAIKLQRLAPNFWTISTTMLSSSRVHGPLIIPSSCFLPLSDRSIADSSQLVSIMSPGYGTLSTSTFTTIATTEDPDGGRCVWVSAFLVAPR